MSEQSWEKEAERYSQNADYWRDRAEKAEAELARRDEIITRLDGENKSMRHIFSLWRKTEAIKEIDRLKEIIARLKEDAERLAVEQNYFCCQKHEAYMCHFEETDAHNPDCPITLHRALMKELE